MLLNLGAYCSTNGPYWVTITWQQIFEDSLHVTLVGVGVGRVLSRVANSGFFQRVTEAVKFPFTTRN